MLADQLDYIVGVDPHRDSHATKRQARAVAKRYHVPLGLEC
jgi:hypothetical protein